MAVFLGVISFKLTLKLDYTICLRIMLVKCAHPARLLIYYDYDNLYL